MQSSVRHCISSPNPKLLTPAFRKCTLHFPGVWLVTLQVPVGVPYVNRTLRLYLAIWISIKKGVALSNEIDSTPECVNSLKEITGLSRWVSPFKSIVLLGLIAFRTFKFGSVSCAGILLISFENSHQEQNTLASVVNIFWWSSLLSMCLKFQPWFTPVVEGSTLDPLFGPFIGSDCTSWSVSSNPWPL